jgi:hypothetical protein
MTVSQAQELGGLWRLRIMDLKHHVKAEATIRFTSTATDSCMGGKWKRIIVEARVGREEEFFPLADPLAYELERG